MQQSMAVTWQQSRFSRHPRPVTPIRRLRSHKRRILSPISLRRETAGSQEILAA